MKTLLELSDRFFGMLDLSPQSSDQSENDKLCFEKALSAFLKSGRKEDAFTVYFCYCEIFKLFGQGYENTKKLLELLSDHEYHSGELLTKHRDHYSHSVYVFALGLAIYANDAEYRKSFLKFYGLEDDGKSACSFLKFWGMTALFHDIGYPFQLAHEQIKSYAEEVWVGDEEDKDKKREIMERVPYVSYGNMHKFLAFDERVKEQLKKAFPQAKQLDDVNQLLAYGMFVREGYDVDAVCDKLLKRVEAQPDFMDHGYFSAVILSKHLFSVDGFVMDIQHLDALTAILLHNNFNKYDAPKPNKHPIAIDEHPLAYLITLCDELQCWDRLAYGKVSKKAPIAWDVNLEIFDNEIIAKYFYDSYFVRVEDKNGVPKMEENKNYSEMRDGIFTKKIFSYVVSPLVINVQTEEKKKPRRYKLYASDDSFINICDLAKAIHISYDKLCRGYSNSYINQSFGELPLEFKISNIEQAKSYAEKLELINCFYSSKDLDYPIVEDFNAIEFGAFKDNLEFLCREEHVRWVQEKLSMGWKYGTDYDPDDKAERNRKKIHRDIVPYEELTAKEREKDELMIKNMLTLLKKFDSNIKIYNYRSGRKPTLEIAGTGHRFIKGGSVALERYKEKIKKILSEYNKDYRVVVYSCFAYGADQLIAECAAELGIAIKAYLPMDYESYVNDVKQDTVANGHSFTEEDELRMRHLLAQTVRCKTIPDEEHTYAAASQYIVDKCKKLIVLWDEKETPRYDKNHKPINRGGTYDTICMAKEAKYKESDIHVISCQR